MARSCKMHLKVNKFTSVIIFIHTEDLYLKLTMLFMNVLIKQRNFGPIICGRLLPVITGQHLCMTLSLRQMLGPTNEVIRC